MVKQSVSRTKIIHFRADQDLLAAIARLEEVVGEGVVGAKSVAIRRAILEAVARLPKVSK